MAVAYGNAMNKLDMPFTVIGRGEESARKFTERTGSSILTGGVDSNAETAREHTHAIVTVNVEELAKTTISLIELGVENILVEKPGGVTPEEIVELKEIAAKNGARVYIGYNRRFYASALKAKEYIINDGGVESFSFDFTEWGHVIANLPKTPIVKENWFLANSTHVIDMAFYLGGQPIEMVSYTKGGVSWHPIASVYAGSGKTDTGALFSYQANWEAPGRWGIEINTKHHKLIFRPLEALQVQKHGSVAIETVDIDDSLDKEFKPGIYRQTEAFFIKPSILLSLDEHAEKVEGIYKKIGNL
ncbi:myo-inositol 2-dehydrogenase [Bacillus sp. FJAT-27225]|nr:myo-inositol 2-dehydrogenase [Bacillus sp. FJAT-27225]